MRRKKQERQEQASQDRPSLRRELTVLGVPVTCTSPPPFLYRSNFHPLCHESPGLGSAVLHPSMAHRMLCSGASSLLCGRLSSLLRRRVQDGWMHIFLSIWETRGACAPIPDDELKSFSAACSGQRRDTAPGVKIIMDRDSWPNIA